MTDPGRAALRRWLDEPPAPRSGEFEGMVKVFFADAGTKDQLLATLDRIEDEAVRRLATLAEFAAGDTPFPRRRHLRALALTLQCEQEQAIRRWARWATEQVVHWSAADDAGAWDVQAVLDHLGSGQGLDPGLLR